MYWEIPGPSKAPKGHCIAFKKYDGSSIRAEWTKKQGWNKFGSRHVLIDETHPLGNAIRVFKNTYADDLEKVFRKNKALRGIDRITVFCEYFGPKSFAGFHEDPPDQMKVMLFDVNLHKKGIMFPRDFIKIFGHLDIAEVVYEGNFGNDFRQDVINGKYDVDEGVVAKGVRPGKSGQHALWMAKVKTRQWFEKLKKNAQENAALRKELSDNMKEQL